MSRQRLVSGENRTFESAPAKPTTPWPASGPVETPSPIPFADELMATLVMRGRSSGARMSAAEQFDIWKATIPS